MIQSRTIRASLIALTVTALMGLAPIASAAQAPAPKANAAQQQKVKQLLGKYKSVAGKLAKIRKDTLKANPDLVKQRDNLKDLIEKRMAKNGYDPKTGIGKLKKLNKQLQSDKLSDKKKAKLKKKLQTQWAAMRKAQQKTMQEKQVRKKTKALRNKMLVAMRKQNGDTDKLMGQLKSLQGQMQNIIKSSRSQSGQ